MRILIVGGGFAGLTLAALLRQTGFRPVVVEKVPRYERVGYVVSLWPLGSRILHGLGLHDRFVSISAPTNVYEVCNDNGHVLHRYEIGTVFEHYGRLRSVMRSDMLALLLKGAGPKNVRMGVTVEKLEPKEDEVRVRFSDGTKDAFDLVVGADGIHSRTRRLLFGDLPLNDIGWAGWAWWLDPKIIPADTINEYWSDSRFFGIYPAKGRTCCFVGVPFRGDHRDDPSVRHETIRRTFGSFGGVVPKILKKLPDPDEITFTRFADIRLEEWRKGRVILIGDAGQGILPTAGIGATMAMESAAVLADELRRADAATVPLALDYFIKRRRTRVDEVQAESRRLASFMLSENKTVSWVVNHLMRFYSANELFKGFSRTLEGAI